MVKFVVNPASPFRSGFINLHSVKGMANDLIDELSVVLTDRLDALAELEESVSVSWTPVP